MQAEPEWMDTMQRTSGYTSHAERPTLAHVPPPLAALASHAYTASEFASS